MPFELLINEELLTAALQPLGVGACVQNFDGPQFKGLP
jgi:hypothetical protein